MPYITLLAENVYVIKTLPVYDFQVAQFATHWQFFQFSVMASSHARVRLYAVADTFDDEFYEITLGDADGRSSIRGIEIGEEAVFEETPNILNSVEYRDFWILWEDDRISVGRGHNFVDVVISLETQSQPQINFVSIATGDGVTGSWRVLHHGRKYDITDR